MRKVATILLLICGEVFAQQQGFFTDSRDGKKYKTVEIGEQKWMAENLNYNAKGSKCYGESGVVVTGYKDDGDECCDCLGTAITTKLSNKKVQDNCKKYGRLYNWATAMDLTLSCNSNSCTNQIKSKHRGLCPIGWHIPSDADWDVLMTAVGGSSSTAGDKLKAKSGWNNNDNGTDEFGFSALPGGRGSSGGSFNDVGNNGYWWSTTEDDDTDYANYRDMIYYSGEGGSTYYFFKSNLFSVRCLQYDTEFALKEAARVAALQSSFTDSRDRKTYKTVKIGDQTWMAENLNYSVKGSICYNDDESNCQKYGRLYDWNTSLKSCPSGWHLPSKDEWDGLVDFAGGEDVAGKYLKAKERWAENGNGTDEYGFSALPGGYGSSDGGFYGVGDVGYWWSATEDGSTNAYYRDMYYSISNVYRSSSGKSYLLSVRCVKD